ncbi:hypothetical protein [Actinokineospora sp. HUAS TT18]|uniref:hypothetical protein n=1 Tax=Actinokineospora sp. HUAS TT18 TaxID=3447451 RepID=UPI003F528302
MSRSTLSRYARALVAVSVGVAGLVSTAGTAVAAPHYTAAPTVQAGHTDSALPDTPFDAAGAMPLGAWADEAGRVHVSRVYVTYDLAQFAGKRITKSVVSFTERETADCSKRAIELWKTETVTRTPSWATAPAEDDKLGEDRSAQYCPGTLSYDVKGEVERAVAKGKSRITFEIRVPADVENDPSYFRKVSYYGVQLSIGYNSPPSIATQDLVSSGFACATSTPYPRMNPARVQARAVDADQEHDLRYDFAVWPRDEPSARAERTYEHISSTPFVTHQLAPESLADGRTYLWQARVSDGVDTSPWSATCGFTVDKSAPAAPTVTSANYPRDEWGPVGESAVFTVAANGDTDTVAFEYSWGDVFSVPACEIRDYGRFVCPDPLAGRDIVRAGAPGGSVTLTLDPPHTFRNRLQVRSVDAAGNRSQAVEYSILVWPSGPAITRVSGEPEWGKPVTVQFAPAERVTGTVSFEVRLDGVAAQVVPAGPDGTATFTFTADKLPGNEVRVRSRSASGWVSHESSWRHYFSPFTTIASDLYTEAGPAGGVGVPGTFTFTPPPGETDIEGYLYSFDVFGESSFVPAGPDGTATITWTPDASGWYYLDAQAMHPNGERAGFSGNLSFEVA